MARNEQLIRQHKIIQILERRRYGASLDDLRDTVVDELGLGSLHVRSIRRDIEALQAAGMPIMTEETQAGKVWKMSRADTGLHRLTITASELIALSMGRDLLIPLVGTQFWQGIEAFWNKVREQLPVGVWEHYERYRRTLRILGVVPKTYEKQQGVLKTLNRAIQEHRRLEVEYESIGQPARKRILEPYGLAIFQSSIYLVAIEAGVVSDQEPQERLRHWKLDRFHRATALDDWFKPDGDVDLDHHLGRSVGIFSGDQPVLYRVRLNTKAARWVQEEPWHAEQQLEPCQDGFSMLTVPAFHPMEIIPNVLRLGADAELIEPLDARQWIADQIAQMGARYQKNKDSSHSKGKRNP